MRAQPFKLGAQISLASPSAGSRHPERRGGAVFDVAGSATINPPSGDLVVGTQPEPGSKMRLGGPAAHVQSHLGEDGLRNHDVDSIDAGQIEAADAIQFAA